MKHIDLKNVFRIYLPNLRWFFLLCGYLVVTILTLEVDKIILSSPALPQTAVERCTWIRYIYVFFIISGGLWFGRTGLVVTVVLSMGALIPQSLIICSNPWVSLKQAVIVIALGTISSLYWIHLRDSAVNRAWYEKAQRKYVQKARLRVEQDKQLSALSNYSQRVALYADIDDVINIGLEITMDAMKADAVAIFSLKDNSRKLHLLSAKGFLDDDNAQVQPIAIGEGIIGKVVKTGTPVFAYDFQEEFSLSGALKEEKFRAIGVVPLIAPGKTVGALMVGIRSGRSFSQQETLVLETLGNQLSLTMENTLLFHEQKDIRKRLGESEKQYREIFERTNDIIWLERLDGFILSGNRACADVLGVEISRLEQTNIFTFITEENISKIKLIREQLTLGVDEEQSYDLPIVNSNGTEIILKVTTNLMEYRGKPGFQHIAKDITEERKLQENQEYYIQHITEAQEEERLRISRELHDSTAQSLIVVIHQLEKFLTSSKHLYISDSRFLFVTVEQVKAILQEVRQFSRDLRPSILDDLGLIPSLEWYFEELNRTHGIKISMHVQGNREQLRPEVRVTLFRIIQEALRNVIKHADAFHARVVIAYGEGEVRVTVSDDGQGFDSKPLGDLLRIGKLGVAGMHERAKLLGGKVDIESVEGKGTTVYITIPITAM
jgi:PAS domain S-box-containing protein